ncbi:hypothetical protein [Spirosoma utsteinense]|uniref:Uncharacterized protein n=1 Tax=Spirosoma utsteinense TaxID=2585773 RepID=A0ABR6W084_9BACT|nr:hypothetical protein [Spirosoma utsteinense]MBC3786591.1 hypothetical protein [Spirosoma utsteinense]MBC3789969.1 hypothetical protein [Spirosoma utsteinense]
MKTSILCLLLVVSLASAQAQIANDNTLSVQIDGKEYKTQPRRIRIGTYWWVTANANKPDKSLRIWLGSYDGKDIIEPGSYLVVDADNPDTKANRKLASDLARYKGIAAIKYVEETKEPRMEYHVGKSVNNDETIAIKKGADGFLEATFSGTLVGSYWKEKASATVFGGMGRLMSKVEDKVVTKTTGYDSDIDPEGNGYKKQSMTDKIVLSNGVFRLKMN